MYSYKNARFHDEIRRWNTRQLLEALESNGLGDCCESVKNRQIDGETFLNLTEGQLAFWRNTLTNVQIKRLWSYIQLARENPKDFITNLPHSTTASLGTANSRKTEKIKSPIAESLNNIIGQQNNPVSPQPEIPESNYPKPMPALTPNNEFQQIAPPRPDALPPKPLSYQNKRVVNPPQDINLRPPVAIPQPSPPPITSYPKPPIVPSIPQHEEQEIYEDEPQSDFQPPTSPINSSSLYKIAPSNPIPIRREVPLPTNFGRPLPTPPKDETPFPLPPNVVPIIRNARSPQPPAEVELPRPPVFAPPTSIPDFHYQDDEEQPDYDIVDEAQIPEYKLQSWFKDIARQEAGKLLRGRPNGTFIARPSKQPNYECTFSVIYESKIYNLPVIKDNGKLVLGKNSFNSVTDIVEKFFDNPLVLNGPNHEDVYVTLRRY